MTEDIQSALRPARMINSDHPDVLAFARAQTVGAKDDAARAVRLYYAVRDQFRYDPYKIDLSPDGLSASRVLRDGVGWCVPKATLLAAACRALGIPARLGLADVRNHLSTERLRAMMGTEVYYRHGYTSIHLHGRWLKATPAFNIELCEKLRLQPLDFDATGDSIYHPFDLDGQRHMEYLAMHGEHDDVPLDDIVQVFKDHYPKLLHMGHASWEADVDAQTQKEHGHG